MSDDIQVDLLRDSEISQLDNFINFKIIIVGDSGVGKSSLLKRAVQNKFDGNYQATIGFEFLLMHFKVNELKIKLQIWDTCGQEMYRSLIQGFYRNTSLALVVYDVSRKETYDALDIWIKDIRDHTEQDIPIFVAGNKCDLQRAVQAEEAKVYSVSSRTKYFTECSAKTGQNVKDIFFEAAKYLYKTYKQFQGQNKLPSSSNKLKIGSDDNNNLNTKKKKCC
jgi:small GTP-binding protein